MISRPERPLLWIKQTYDAALPIASYAALLMVLVVVYLGSVLGPWTARLLPAAIVIIVAFGIAMLQKIEKSISTIGESVVFADMTSGIEALKRTVTSDRDVTRISIIAVTGGTTLTSVLPAICAASPASRVEINLQVIDPDGPFRRYFASHWSTEVQAITQRAFSEYGGERFDLKISAYSHLPVVHGIMINDSTLLVGFTAWSRRGGAAPIFSAADRPHTLYRRNDSDAAQLFWLFEDWMKFAPLSPVFDISKNRTHPTEASNKSLADS